MNRIQYIMRTSLAGLLFLSNFLAVLHVHEFYPADHYRFDSAGYASMLLQDNDDCSEHTSDHTNRAHTLSWVQNELTCPIHFITQGVEAHSAQFESIIPPVCTPFYLSNSQVNWQLRRSSKSNRAPPFIA